MCVAVFRENSAKQAAGPGALTSPPEEEKLERKVASTFNTGLRSLYFIFPMKEYFKATSFLFIYVFMALENSP